MRPVPDSVAPLTKRFEGLKLARYLDPVGVPTIGYGHVLTAKDGPLQTINQETADELLDKDLDAAAANLALELGGLVDTLTPGQYGALIDFVFNLGIGHFAASTLCHLVRAGDMAGAADQFGKWIYARVNGQERVLGGLVARRDAERALFLS